MSYYYKYNFASPEPIFAIVKEELKSYFDSGSIDDLMFPVYVNKCLRHLGRGSYSISETLLEIEDFQARLPDNFIAVREAWSCAEYALRPYQTANSLYTQASSITTIQISPVTVGGEPCGNPVCESPQCPGCMPELIQAVYKTNGEIARSFVRTHLLKPGNISAKKNCGVGYMDNYREFVQNTYSSGVDSFDIRDNKFVTNFRSGLVLLIFYSEDFDANNNQLIPDNYFVAEYIEKYLKYKMFETITNQVMDETFNQMQQKLQYYKQEADEGFILALTEMKKPTPWQIQRMIKSNALRFQKYEISSGRRRRN